MDMCALPDEAYFREGCTMTTLIILGAASVAFMFVVAIRERSDGGRT
jgi:hypothetical protein